jgi:hypothetical protein
MKIVVLNGSPKGEYSVTLQYVHYIQKKFPGHEWKIFMQQVLNTDFAIDHYPRCKAARDRPI